MKKFPHTDGETNLNNMSMQKGTFENRNNITYCYVCATSVLCKIGVLKKNCCYHENEERIDIETNPNGTKRLE